MRLTKIRVFDPACGSGNFLIIAYKELRKLEIRIFKRLKEIGQSSLAMTCIQLNQFYGIEYADFAAETAKLSLWISEYQMNHLFKDEFGDSPPDLPLRESGNVIHDNALRMNWSKVCPQAPETETYIVGNPPYLGTTAQDEDQKADMTHVFGAITKNYKSLDYVAAWYVKATDYGQTIPCQVAFVATNSICQGEQVPMLWPILFQRGWEIGFAHQSFHWKNNASSNAGVTCVIVNIRKKSTAKKTLYSGEMARAVRNIGPYLLEMDDSIVAKQTEPLNGMPKMVRGNMPVDGGNLILSPEEREELTTEYPNSKKIIRKLVGSQEFIRGLQRYCLWIKDDDLQLAMSIPPIAIRIESVKEMRLKSVDPGARAMATTPHQFREMGEAKNFTVISPIHFSEDREYLTIGALDGDGTVITNACFGIYDTEPAVFAILSSKLHHAWVTSVCGRIRNDIRYSSTMGYHTFPIPALSLGQKQELEEHALKVLEARELHAGKTIAWLYNPESMPANLLEAHKNLDSTLERICIGRTFKSDTERLEYLFKQYSLLLRQGMSNTEPELKLKDKKK